MRDKSIKWSDIVTEQGKARDVVWMHCVIDIQDDEEWKKCVESACPRKDCSDIWIHWFTTSVLKQIIGKGDSTKIRRAIDTILSAHDSFTIHMPITLLSIIVEVLKENNLLVAEQYKAMEEVMSIYSEGNIDEVPEELLVGTKEWVSLPRNGEESADLLQLFYEKVEEFTGKNFIKESTYFQNAIVFTDRLRKRRDSLYSG